MTACYAHILRSGPTRLQLLPVVSSNIFWYMSDLYSVELWEDMIDVIIEELKHARN